MFARTHEKYSTAFLCILAIPQNISQLQTYTCKLQNYIITLVAFTMQSALTELHLYTLASPQLYFQKYNRMQYRGNRCIVACEKKAYFQKKTGILALLPEVER